jgi:hypothetical protein
MDHIALEVDTESFVNVMIKSFRNLSRWGYVLPRRRRLGDDATVDFTGLAKAFAVVLSSP